MRLLILACVMLAAGTLSGPQLTKPDRLGEVRDFHKWTKVNPRPMFSSYWVDTLCVNPKPEDARRAATSPHRQKTITVWVNSVGRKAMLEGGAFPVGSTIVKEKREGANGAVELSTVMIKRPEGYNPACGDWEFAVLDKTGEKVKARGKIPTCAGCHVEQAKFDYVFRSYLPRK